MSWFKKVFSWQNSQETKVLYQKTEDRKSNQTDDKQEEEGEKITESIFKIDETQSSQSSQSSKSSWWSSWSSLSSQLAVKKENLAMTRIMMMRNGGNHFVALQIKKKKRNQWKYQLKQQLIKTIIKKMIIKKMTMTKTMTKEKLNFL